jgi:hypothetical protein
MLVMHGVPHGILKAETEDELAKGFRTDATVPEHVFIVEGNVLFSFILHRVENIALDEVATGQYSSGLVGLEKQIPHHAALRVVHKPEHIAVRITGKWGDSIRELQVACGTCRYLDLNLRPGDEHLQFLRYMKTE